MPKEDYPMSTESKKCTEELLSRAVFAHINYDNCDGVLTYLGKFPSDIVPDVYEFVFECKKCKGKVTLI